MSVVKSAMESLGYFIMTVLQTLLLVGLIAIGTVGVFILAVWIGGWLGVVLLAVSATTAILLVR